LDAEIFVDDHWAEQAAKVKDAYVKSLSDPDSHLEDMDEEDAEQVYDIALDIYMGKPVQLGSCRPATSTSPSDDDGDGSASPENPDGLVVSGPGYSMTLSPTQISHTAEIIGTGQELGF